MRKFIGLLLALIVVTFAATGCLGDGPSNPAPDSDSQQAYDGGNIPTDLSVYTIVGKVNADTKSLTRQVSPGGGSVFGVNGFVSGSFFGPVESGKGFVRLTVVSANPSTDLAPVGKVVVLKMTDTKGTVLTAGDEVTLKCRRQYEAVAAVQDNQKFDADADATWELDFCRLATPVLGTPDAP